MNDQQTRFGVVICCGTGPGAPGRKTGVGSGMETKGGGGAGALNNCRTVPVKAGVTYLRCSHN